MMTATLTYHETEAPAWPRPGRRRRNRPPEGKCRPRPITPDTKVGRVLLALEFHGPNVCHCRRVKARPPVRKCARKRPMDDVCREAFPVGPPCYHLLRRDHRFPPDAWAELLRRYDPRGMRERPAPPGEKLVSRDEKLAAYTARVRAGLSLFSTCDTQEMEEAFRAQTGEVVP